MPKRILIIQIVMVCIVGVLFLAYVERQPRSGNVMMANSSTTPLQMGKGIADPLSLINPEVTANLGKRFIINFKPLRDKLAAMQQTQPQKTYIYFLYLNNSSWIGLNEKVLFTAASTIKVPLAMSIYKAKDRGLLNLKDAYSLDQLDIDDNFGELYKVGPDKTFTIEDLLGIMLVYSDNTAMRALSHIMKLVGVEDPLADVYNTMGWEYIDFGNTPTYIEINLKTLSNMFMALYNATYNGMEDSKAILSYLTQSPFTDQIVAGLPKTIIVAHKIGVNNVDDTYSDCGIVYAPKQPYVLCVGSSGTSEDKADSFIKKVSSTVYQYVINN